MLGAALLVFLPIIAVTGLLSNAAYDPRLGGNGVGRNLGPLDFYLFPWPTHPSWLYAATQGLHVTLGLAAIPLVLAKLWSVIPRLFEWPALRSPAHALERLSIWTFIASTVFEFATGALNIQNDYVFGFFFTDAHYYGGWVFICSLVVHIALKLPTMRQALATRGALAPLRESLATTLPEPRTPADNPLIPTAPSAPTMSRRVLLGTVTAGSGLLLLQGAGQSIGGPLRELAFLAPRGRNPNSGPNGFQINKTFDATGLTAGDLGSAWRLHLVGARRVQLSRAQLLALPQRTYDLPIACVEGWSTTQRWTGVRIRDLAALAGRRPATETTASSLERDSLYSVVTLSAGQVADERCLLALRVNGVDLSHDHGFPARVIGPGLPGVHCTKWIDTLTFQEA